ncbi:hypothetical protein SAMN02746065_11065 [Desulfocicer vacuolatum DSM 3385]|uniref:Uncharacterized protein n=1 Tax=Desulfocicer vacuolatum DSM 3385 TaxID=1121400 RepID=A0A1W2C2P5_9BACT|nr:hypothetical protein [Desulfocicer vacuolatum]SMC78978.1 hypothetical protein SAMN02746065_11065 [Desulfocicer vacuolatum DSM 3385]
MMENKKLAAATAAVFTYIKTQEEAAFYAAGPAPEEEAVAAPAAGPQVQFNAWGAAGRNDQMQGRFLMQARAFK